MHTTLPLPHGMRALLLDVLALAYPAGAAQARLHNAPDAAVAWQVQSMLDDHASHETLSEGWRGLEA
jgi:hypothetical protein